MEVVLKVQDVEARGNPGLNAANTQVMAAMPADAVPHLTPGWEGKGPGAQGLFRA